MELTEIFADERGETRFRKIVVDFVSREFAPPSMPVQVSSPLPTTTALFMIAPPGWDKEFHPTPRKQFCVMLRGKLTVEATSGEIIDMGPGDILVVNDPDSKGHLSTIQGSEDAAFMFVGFDGEFPVGS